MEILSYETYTNNTLSDRPVSEQDFPKYRKVSYILIDLLTGINFLTYTSTSTELSKKINFCLSLQIDFLNEQGIDTFNDTTSSRDVTIGKVHIGADNSNISNSSIHNSLSPLVIEILSSLGFINRQVFIKDEV